MKKIILFFFVIPFSITAQEFQGKAYYMSKTILNTDFIKNIPPERRERVLSRMKSNSEKNYVLDFNTTSSLFKEEVQLETTGGNQRWSMFSSLGSNEGTVYRDILSNAFISKQELLGKTFLIKDTLTKSKWTMTGQTKKIGIYTCYNATQEVESEVRAIQFGRSSQRASENKDVPKKTKITTLSTWFTPEIPVATGPSFYSGLPGLILEVSDDNRTILCTKVVLNPKEKIKIKAPKKGTVVNNEEFKKIQEDKIKEMREQFGRGRRQGGGNRIRIQN